MCIRDSYKDEMPLFVDNESLQNEGEKSDLEKRLDSFFDEIFKQKESVDKTPKRRNNPQSTKQSRSRTSKSEEIRKRNEKIKKQRERQKKRKNFFKKIFGDN